MTIFSSFWDTNVVVGILNGIVSVYYYNGPSCTGELRDESSWILLKI